MTDVYCDQTLGSGSDNGTDWANAYKLLPTAMDGTNLVAGDILWVQHNNASAGTSTLKGLAAYSNNPVQVIGCIAGTTNEPPVPADIFPGLRNGSGTRAYAQTAGNAPPIFKTTTAGADLNLQGHIGLMYGIVIKSRDNFAMGVESDFFLEECELRCGDGESGFWNIGLNSRPFMLHMKNSKFSAGTSGSLSITNVGPGLIFEGVEFDIPANPMITPGEMNALFDGCDFSAQSGAIVGNAGGQGPNAVIKFTNCKINASSARVTGTIADRFRIEFHQTSSVTGKGTGATFQELNIYTSEGNILEELTGVRSGGADDGGTGGWAMAFTPGIDGTRDNLRSLVGPWTAKKVAGDGTSQTLTVYIANDTGADLFNDDAWLEVKAPSEAGDANYDFYTTQMPLMLATPVVITDDAVSSWTSPAANPQKFAITIAPDYNGFVFWRVVFAKNFGATPKTLFVDTASDLS